MTQPAIEHALLAVLAAHSGDEITAADHITRAQQQARAAARRDRQLVEIAALAVNGDTTRAAGLALQHAAEFPTDVELLAGFSPTAADMPSTPPG